MSGAQPASLPAREADSAAASAVKAAQAEGRHADARERYAELVARHQRRAARIAFHYLRDAADADEAVQDAFIKAFSHLASFRGENAGPRCISRGFAAGPRAAAEAGGGAGEAAAAPAIGVHVEPLRRLHVP